jgi:hypothetical protein
VTAESDERRWSVRLDSATGFTRDFRGVTTSEVDRFLVSLCSPVATQDTSALLWGGSPFGNAYFDLSAGWRIVINEELPL